MENQNIVFLIPILVPTALFAMIFGIVYLTKRERMAMIERGMDPRRYKQKQKSAPFDTLKAGLLLMGAGIGLFLAFLLSHTVFKNVGNDFDDDGIVAIYFALIAIFGGGGLLLSFIIEKRDSDKEDKKDNVE